MILGQVVLGVQLVLGSCLWGGQFKAGTSHPMTPAKISVWEIRKISPPDHNFKFWSVCERVRVRVNTVAVGCHFLVVYVENCATYFSAMPFLYIHHISQKWLRTVLGHIWLKGYMCSYSRKWQLDGRVLCVPLFEYNGPSKLCQKWHINIANL